MSLLTPSESRVFQSFLSSLDSAAFPADLNMQLEISHEHMPPARGKEALTKATKDLMSLDGDKWRYPLGSSPGENPATPAHRHPQVQTNSLSLLYSTRQQRRSSSKALETDQETLLSARAASSSFRGQEQQPSLHYFINSATDSSRAVTRSCDRSSSSSSGKFPIDPSGSSSFSSTHTWTPVSPASTKRSPPPDANLSNKRHRFSPTSQELLGEAQQLPQNKAALLSPSQKKANHIQSEQKRRANIRRGYDALCETVPALREACQAEDEQNLANDKTRNRRKGKGKAKNDDGEKIDGRAGPRSENVVLSKTIDYINELLSEREALMQRFHVARSTLPVDHPLLRPQPDTPSPWERKWTGGEKKEGDDDDDDDDDD
ncbi:hypothetical protein BDN67DRAFT_988269 [Paxillus ammoniavirescens]|nr:hypothetical protein BDN67DRAFT_988269 [Paxillus ammoniavirescens]